MDENNKIYWHEAFQEALQLELHQYKDSLEFDNNYRLSEEALQMDVVVIKKDKAVKIDKNIGRIFKGSNIFEYKSESVTFSRWDYNKVLGYAFLYSSFTKTPLTDITISIALTIYPQKLINFLEECGFKVSNVDNGIYYIDGDVMPVQILESKSMSPEDNLFLRNLRSNLSAKDMAKTIEFYKKQKPLDIKNIYFDRLIRANFNAYKEVMKMTEETVNLVLEAAEEMGLLAGINKRREDEKAKRIAKKMLERGDSPEEVAEIMEMPLETVTSLQSA